MYQCFHRTSLKQKSFLEIQREYALPDSHAFYYEQASAYWKQTRLQPCQLFKTSFLERITSQYYSISRLYPQLQTNILKPVSSTPVSHWIKDIPEIDSMGLLITGHLTILRHVPSENWKETQIKISHRAYSTDFKDPDSGNHPFPTNACPKCKQPWPTLTHLLWQCTHIQRFRILVNKYVSRITRRKITLTPVMHLFGIDPPIQPRRERHRQPTSLFAHISFLTAKRCILLHWIDASPPTMATFRTNLQKLYLLDKLDVDFNYNISRATFLRKWRDYILVTFDEPTSEAILNPQSCKWQPLHKAMSREKEPLIELWLFRLSTTSHPYGRSITIPKDIYYSSARIPLRKLPTRWWSRLST